MPAYDLTKLSAAGLAVLHNAVLDRADGVAGHKPVNKFSDRAAALRRVTAMLAAAKTVVIEDGDTYALADEPTPPAAGTLTLANTVNPCRPGTRRHERFEAMRRCTTVAQYVATAAAEFSRARAKAMRDVQRLVASGHVQVAS